MPKYSSSRLLYYFIPPKFKPSIFSNIRVCAPEQEFRVRTDFPTHTVCHMINFNLKLNLLLIAGQYIAAKASSLQPSLKTLHRISRFRTGWYSDDHEELDRIFQAIHDPWNFQSSPYEQERLRVLLEEVRQLPHDTVCEIGCAEGIFTAELSKICRDITAIDVSPTALHRAKLRCRHVRYLLTSIENFHHDGQPFDLVLCSETLYYIKDIPAAVRQLCRLGRYCIVSYLEREAGRLDRYFTSLPEVRRRIYEFRTGAIIKRMVCVTWKNQE